MPDYSSDSLDRFLENELFVIGDTTVTASTLIIASIMLLLTIWLSRRSRTIATKLLSLRGIDSEGTIGLVAGTLRYSVLLLGFALVLRIIGVSVATFFTAGAIFAVGVGFAMQNITQNFVSGVILLAERTIKPGDIIEIAGALAKIKYMGIRSTIVITRDGEELVVPNSELVQNSVKNFTLSHNLVRLHSRVGVSYDSDLSVTDAALRRAVEKSGSETHGFRSDVLLSNFGNSSVDFDVMIWVRDPWNAPLHLSRLNFEIWEALKEDGITIAYPQLDVHVQPEKQQKPNSPEPTIPEA